MLIFISLVGLLLMLFVWQIYFVVSVNVVGCLFDLFKGKVCFIVFSDCLVFVWLLSFGERLVWLCLIVLLYCHQQFLKFGLFVWLFNVWSVLFDWSLDCRLLRYFECLSVLVIWLTRVLLVCLLGVVVLFVFWLVFVCLCWCRLFVLFGIVGMFVLYCIACLLICLLTLGQFLCFVVLLFVLVFWLGFVFGCWFRLVGFVFCLMMFGLFE